MSAFLAKVMGLPETVAVRALRLTTKYPPLFVVGPPRSGTTVVIQHILNSFEFAYFPNLAKQHPYAPVTFATLARLRYRYQPSYESAFGIIDGPMAPSDGWDIFHRWFPRYDFHVAIKQDRLYELRNIVRLLEVVFRAPFANKNNANTVRIDQLSTVFPDAIFVSVKRDVTDTVASVVASRVKHATPPNEWWGVAPPQFWDREFVSETERAVYQTLGITEYVDSSLSKLPPSRYTQIAYETFCAEPTAVLEWIAQCYRDAGVALRKRPGAVPTSFRVKEKNDEQHAALRLEVSRIAQEYGGPDGTR